MMVIAVTNRKLCQDCFTDRVRILINSQPFLVILREKDLTDAEYENLAAEIIKESKNSKAILSLNRPHIALKLGIENVHLTLTDIEKNDRPEKIKRVGVSVHSLEDAIKAEKLGADYLIAGHIYATDCKKGLAPRGIEFLRSVISVVGIPVFAIGGICEGNFHEPLNAGARGVCLMSELMTCRDPQKQINIYKQYQENG